jgi:hypothetical protein
MVTLSKNIIRCLLPNERTKFIYLGKEYYIMKSFILTVDGAARPKWCPKWFLRLLELYRDNNPTAYKLHNKITKGIRIIDMGVVNHSYDIIIYGYFNPEIKYKIEIIKEELLNETNTQI